MRFGGFVAKYMGDGVLVVKTIASPCRGTFKIVTYPHWV
jgi:hypothetical protein